MFQETEEEFHRSSITPKSASGPFEDPRSSTSSTLRSEVLPIISEELMNGNGDKSKPHLNRMNSISSQLGSLTRAISSSATHMLKRFSEGHKVAKTKVITSEKAALKRLSSQLDHGMRNEFNWPNIFLFESPLLFYKLIDMAFTANSLYIAWYVCV